MFGKKCLMSKLDGSEAMQIVDYYDILEKAKYYVEINAENL